MSSICGCSCGSSSYTLSSSVLPSPTTNSASPPKLQVMPNDNQNVDSSTKTTTPTISVLPKRSSDLPLLNVQHVEVEDQIPSHRAYYQHLLRSLDTNTFYDSQTMALLVDRSFTIQAMTGQGFQLTGFKAEELVGKEMAKLMMPAEAAKHTKQAAAMVEVAYHKGALFQHKTIKVETRMGHSFNASIAILPCLPLIQYFLAVITKEEGGHASLEQTSKRLEQISLYQQAITIMPTSEEIGMHEAELQIHRVHFLKSEGKLSGRAKSFGKLILELLKPQYQTIGDGQFFYLLCDASFHVVALTESTQRTTGYRPDEIIGQNFMNLVEITFTGQHKNSDSKKNFQKSPSKTTPRSIQAIFFKKGYDQNLFRKSFRAELKIYDTKTPYYLIFVQFLQERQTPPSLSPETLKSFNFSSSNNSPQTTPTVTPRTTEFAQSIPSNSSVFIAVDPSALNVGNIATERQKIFGEIFTNASILEFSSDEEESELKNNK